MVAIGGRASLSMRLSTKLGIASLAMLVLSGVLAVLAPRLPLEFVAGFLACIFGVWAALRGTKWWLVVPGILIVLFLLILFIAYRAF